VTGNFYYLTLIRLVNFAASICIQERISFQQIGASCCSLKTFFFQPLDACQTNAPKSANPLGEELSWKMRPSRQALAACMIMLGAGSALVFYGLKSGQKDATMLESYGSGDSIFGGRSIFAAEPRPRRAAGRGRHQAEFFSEDHSIFSRGRMDRFAKKKKPRAVDSVSERLITSSRSAGGNYTVQPSGFLEGIVDEVEQIRKMPKTAQEQLQESESSVLAAKEQLKVADELRNQAADDKERAAALLPHVAPLEEVALAKDARARWFDERAVEAEQEAKKEQEEIDALEDEDEKPTLGSLKQKLLMQMVNKVVRKVEQAHRTNAMKHS
jgi:hypothetical protein